MEWSICNHLFFSKKIGSHLLYSSLTNMLIELKEQSYQELMILRENNFINLNMDDDKYQLLIKGKFLVKSNETEINKIILSNLANQYNNSRLNLTIAPTRTCNFACIYCYEEDRARISMNQKTINGIINFIERYPHIESVNVTWYGGEPTLALPTIKKLTQKIIPLTKKYSATLITNGFLLDKIIPYLHELNIKGIQITIDGCESTHNQRRPLLNGNKTFDRIMKNIILLMDKINIHLGSR